MRVSARTFTMKAAAVATAAIAAGAASPAAASTTTAHERTRPRPQANLVICKDVPHSHSHQRFTFLVSDYGVFMLRDGECTSIHARPGRTWIGEGREAGYRLRDIRVSGDRFAYRNVRDRIAIVRTDRHSRVVVRFVNEPVRRPMPTPGPTPTGHGHGHGH